MTRTQGSSFPAQLVGASVVALALLVGCVTPKSVHSKREALNAPDLARLPTFSHAVRADSLLFLSGTLGTIGEGFELASDGTGGQTRQALTNIRHILAAAGLDMESIVSVRVYLTDMADFDEMNEAYLESFPGRPPARTTIGCEELALGASVEIEAIAFDPSRRQ